MDVFTIYLADSLDVLNGITAFAVLQSLAFIYWSQSDDFKDSVRFRGHLYSAGLILTFFVLYAVALFVVTKSQVRLIGHLPDSVTGANSLKTPLTAAELQCEAWTSMWERIGVVAVFHALSIFALTRYVLDQFTLPNDRSAV